MPVPKAAGGKAGGLLGLWLRLLVCLTQGEDGQLNVLRLNGALELLADVAGQHRHGNRPLAADAVLILHNVCFSSANKPRLLANGTQCGARTGKMGGRDAERVVSTGKLPLAVIVV